MAERLALKWHKAAWATTIRRKYFTVTTSGCRSRSSSKWVQRYFALVDSMKLNLVFSHFVSGVHVLCATLDLEKLGGRQSEHDFARSAWYFHVAGQRTSESLETSRQLHRRKYAYAQWLCVRLLLLRISEFGQCAGEHLLRGQILGRRIHDVRHRRVAIRQHEPGES